MNLKAIQKQRGDVVNDDAFGDSIYTKAWNSKGVLLEELLKICRSRLIVQTLQDLMCHLRELIDHKVIAVTHTKLSSTTSAGGVNSGDFITLFLPTSVLQALVAPRASERKDEQGNGV